MNCSHHISRLFRLNFSSALQLFFHLTRSVQYCNSPTPAIQIQIHLQLTYHSIHLFKYPIISSFLTGRGSSPRHHPSHLSTISQAAMYRVPPCAFCPYPSNLLVTHCSKSLSFIKASVHSHTWLCLLSFSLYFFLSAHRINTTHHLKQPVLTK